MEDTTTKEVNEVETTETTPSQNRIVSYAVGPGRAQRRRMMHWGRRKGTKKLTRGRLQAFPGKYVPKGCFGNSIPKSLQKVAE